MMPKAPAVTIKTTETGPFHMGETVVFDLQPSANAGPITTYGSRDGVILCVWANVVGDLDFVITASQAWLASPGPLHCEAKVSQLLKGRVKTVATCQFEIE